MTPRKTPLGWEYKCRHCGNPTRNPRIPINVHIEDIFEDESEGLLREEYVSCPKCSDRLMRTIGAGISDG